jgi:hypothetical protein
MLSDITIVADTTIYDLLYINKKIEETIFIPPTITYPEIIRTRRLPVGHLQQTQLIENGIKEELEDQID